MGSVIGVTLNREHALTWTDIDQVLRRARVCVCVKDHLHILKPFLTEMLPRFIICHIRILVFDAVDA